MLASSRASSASRDETVFDSAEMPSRALRTLGAVPANVVEIASRLAASVAESTCPTVPARSSNASVTSYGDVVRASGMRRPGSCRCAPSGSTARNLSPSSVLIAIVTVLASPTQVSRTRKPTVTFAPSSRTLVTSPTFTPATRTSFPDRSPAASLKSAL